MWVTSVDVTLILFCGGLEGEVPLASFSVPAKGLAAGVPFVVLHAQCTPGRIGHCSGFGRGIGVSLGHTQIDEEHSPLALMQAHLAGLKRCWQV